MQWDGSVNAGFSAASRDRLYIPLDSAEDRPTVQAQMADKTSLYHEVKRLIYLCDHSHRSNKISARHLCTCGQAVIFLQ